MRRIREAARLELGEEQARTLREVADALIFAAGADEASRSALATARAVLLAMRSTNLHDQQWIDQLADDLEDCGPTAHRMRKWTVTH
jgi:hypothetical protein